MEWDLCEIHNPSAGSLPSAIETLSGCLKRLGGTWPDEQATFLRISTSMDAIDALAWIRAQEGLQRFFWSARDSIDEVAGLGVACEVAHAMPRLRAGSALRFFGLMRFDKQEARWTLPRVELVRNAERTELACYFREGENPGDLLAILAQLKPPASGVGQVRARSKTCEDSPLAIDAVLAAIASGEVRKVVLAKQKILVADERLDPFELLQRVRLRAPLAYHFCFEVGEGRYFVGASPEQLYKRVGRRVESEAQAGTRARGLNEADDRRLEEELRSSEKDRLEHELVLENIERTLGELCVDHGTRDHRQVVKLPNVQHLRSRLGGVLKESVRDADLLEALHPTPAVCGTPGKRAMEMIAKLEGFDRGYYAGPIGYVGGQTSELAVALRSGEVEGCEIRLFAGAGIVAGSKLVDESVEIANKLRLWVDLLQ